MAVVNVAGAGPGTGRLLFFRDLRRGCRTFAHDQQHCVLVLGAVLGKNSERSCSMENTLALCRVLLSSDHQQEREEISCAID